MNKWDLFSVHDEQVRFIFCWWWTSEIYFLFMMKKWDLFSVHDERVWFTFCSWWRSEIYSLFMMNKWDLSSVHDEQARFTFCSWWTSEICFVFMMNKQDFLFIHDEQVRFVFCSWWTSETCFLFMMNKRDFLFIHDEQVRFVFRFHTTCLGDLQWLLISPTITMIFILLFLYGYPVADILPVTINAKAKWKHLRFLYASLCMNRLRGYQLHSNSCYKSPLLAGERFFCFSSQTSYQWSLVCCAISVRFRKPAEVSNLIIFWELCDLATFKEEEAIKNLDMSVTIWGWALQWWLMGT